MGDVLTPRLDVEWGPVLVGGATTAVCGIAALFVFQRPSWLFPASLLGGAAAGLRGGYYSQNAINGAVGVALGFLVLFPVLVGFRALWLGSMADGDLSVGEFAFLGLTGATTDVAVFGPLFLLLGFLGATAIDWMKTSPDRSPRRH